jgi:hypothetical protein
MASFKRLKKSLGAMFSPSRKLYLLASVAVLFTATARAETGEVAAVGSGRDASEATVSLLRSTVTKYFKDEPAILTRNVLQNEIIPNASSFVQSYKVLESGKGGVSISANVDLDVLRALFSVRAEKLGEPAGAKVLVIVKGARIPDSLTTSATTLNPYAAIELAAKERLTRRQFTPVSLSSEELQDSGAGDDVASAELLRGLGAKAEARLAIGVSSHYETFENENSHSKDERLMLTAILVDVKSGVVIGRATGHFTNPKAKRDQYNIELQKILSEESKDLFQEMFVMAGKRLSKESGHDERTIVRVQYPLNGWLISRFRTALESVKGVKSVLESGAARGRFDLSVKPAIGAADLSKGLLAQTFEDFTITEVPAAEAGAVEEGDIQPNMFVRLAPKAPSTSEAPANGGRNAIP